MEEWKSKSEELGLQARKSNIPTQVYNNYQLNGKGKKLQRL